MLSDLKAPEFPEIKPLNKPSFGKFEESDGSVDPMLSHRIIEESDVKAYESRNQPRFNADLDCIKGQKSYEYFMIDSDLRKKPQFNSGRQGISGQPKSIG